MPDGVAVTIVMHREIGGMNTQIVCHGALGAQYEYHLSNLRIITICLPQGTLLLFRLYDKLGDAYPVNNVIVFSYAGSVSNTQLDESQIISCV